MISMKEAVCESLIDESSGVYGFVRGKLGYALPLMTIRPQFLNGLNEAER